MEFAYLALLILASVVLQAFAANTDQDTGSTLPLSIIAAMLLPLIVIASLVLLFVGCYRNNLGYISSTVLVYLFILSHSYGAFLMICWEDGINFAVLNDVIGLLAFSVPAVLVALALVTPFWLISQNVKRRREKT